MFLTKEEFNAILDGNYELFEEVLSRVHNKSVEDAMKATPELTARLIKSSVAIKSAITKFKDSHKDFAGHDDIVRRVIQEVETENPGASYEEILRKSEPLIRDAIKTTQTPQAEQSKLSLTDLDNKLY